jgi:hypothetical protein
MDSYLYRLASANRMDTETLRLLVTGDRRKSARPRTAVLSRLSGRSEHTLLCALPELTVPGLKETCPMGPLMWWGAGPGCRLCNAARGAVRGARVWHAPEDVLCPRHRRWTVGVNDNGEQPDLADQAEIVAAHRAYRRLARAHGRETVREAYLLAGHIIVQWHKRGFYDYTRTDGFNRRITRFLGPDWRVSLDSPLAAAAKYPQVVALTRLLASPYWTDLALRDHIAAGRPNQERRAQIAAEVFRYRRSALNAGVSRNPFIPRHLVLELMDTYLLFDGPSLRIFLDEVRRTVEPGYKWFPYPKESLTGNGPYEPLVDMIYGRARPRLALRGSLANARSRHPRHN